MMLHHPARRTAGAAGVDEAGGVLAPHTEPARLGLLDPRRAAFDQRAPVVDRHLALLPDAQAFHADDEMRIGAHHRGHQRARQLGSRDDHRPRAAVVEDMLMVAFGVGRIGRDGDAARGHDAEVGDAPFGAVFAHQHHPVALFQPELAQIMRERRDLPRNLPPAQRLPRAIGFAPQEGIVPATRRAVEKHRDQTGEMVEMGVLQLHASRSPREDNLVIWSVLGAIAAR